MVARGSVVGGWSDVCQWRGLRAGGVQWSPERLRLARLRLQGLSGEQALRQMRCLLCLPSLRREALAEHLAEAEETA